MPPAPRPPNEAERFAALLSCGVLDTQADPAFDAITRLASDLAGTPIALVSLVADTRQWFKSRVGLDASETPRDLAFCAYAILDNAPLIIEDATRDERTRDNDLVTGAPFIRFYAGFPISLSTGEAIGTLCVIDTKPRTISPDTIARLSVLADQAAAQIELIRQRRVAEASAKEAGTLRAALDAHACYFVTDGASLIEANDAFSAMLGYRDAQTRGRGLPEFRGENGKIVDWWAVRSMASARGWWQGEVTIRCGRGVINWLDLTCLPHEAGLACRAFDITPRKRAEQRLVEAETRISLAQKAVGAGHWDWDVRGGLFETSDEFYEMIGVEPPGAPLSVESYVEHIHPEDRESVVGLMDACGQGAVPQFEAEFRFAASEGRYIWVRSTGRAIHTDLRGHPTRVLGQHIDIDSTKRLSSALAKSFNLGSGDDLEGSLIELCECVAGLLEVDFVGVAEVETDASGRRVAHIVGGWDRQGPAPALRYDLEGTPCAVAVSDTFCYINDGVADIFPRDRILADMNARGYIGVRIVDSVGDTMGLLFAVHRGPIHRAYDLESMLRVFAQRAGGEIERARFARRQAEVIEQLRETTVALDAASDCVLVFDAGSLRFVYANEGACRRFGYAREQLSRMSPVDLLVGHDAGAFDRLLGPLRSGAGAPLVYRTEYEHRGGHHVPVEVSIQYVPELGKEGRFVSIVRDISDRLAAERALTIAKDEAEAANKAKSEFLANMSHEIRTPMTAILGYADVLRDDAPEIDAEQAIASIRSNADHLLTIVNDILDVSKIEAGQMAVEQIQTDVAEVIDDVVSLVEPLCEEKSLTIDVRYDTPIPDRFASDPTRLRQVLFNLVGNAVKFTEAGGVSITTRWDRKTGSLLIRVRDTGIGMTPAQLAAARRFEPFSQADSSVTRRFGGSGLGLAICHGLSRMLGGHIEIESEAGVGSTFVLVLPTGPIETARLVRPALMPTRRPPRPDAPGERTDARLRGVRIVLAEDGIDNQRLISYILARAGADVTVCENGRVALERIAALPREPDLIVMDMQMPELDGYSAASRLRANGFDGPIVALTAHAMASDKAKCLDAGCSDYLTKPINRDALVDACARWVGRRHVGGPAVPR